MAISRTLQQDILRANCQPTDQPGDCIYFTGPVLATYYQVAKASPRDLIPTSGIILSKSSSTVCLFRVAGLVSGLYTGLTAGGMVWVDVDGRLVQSSAGITALSGQKVLVQAVGFALSDTVVSFSPMDPLVRIA